MKVYVCVLAEMVLSWCQRLLGMKRGLRAEARNDRRRWEAVRKVRLEKGFHPPQQTQ